MKIAAVILSCLVLTLSAGIGRGMPCLRDRDPAAAQIECCRQCGCCDAISDGHDNADDHARNDGGSDARRGDATDKNSENASGSDAHNAQRGCCPFCAGSFSKGLYAAATVSVPPVSGENHDAVSLFVCRIYVPPFVGGIWQPPRTVLPV